MSLTLDERQSLEKAVQTAQGIIAAYQELAYKVLLAHVALVAGTFYFLGTATLTDKGRCIVSVTVVIETALLTWWLWNMKVSSSAHVNRAKSIWDQLTPTGSPLVEPKERGHSMWTPLLLLVVLSGLAVVAFAWLGSGG